MLAEKLLLSGSLDNNVGSGLTWISEALTEVIFWKHSLESSFTRVWRVSKSRDSFFSRAEMKELQREREKGSLTCTSIHDFSLLLNEIIDELRSPLERKSNGSSSRTSLELLLGPLQTIDVVETRLLRDGRITVGVE